MEEGDITWAKLTGHPWWPALICRHPVLKTYEQRNGGKHVQFFDKPPNRAWVKEKNMRVFCGSDESECQKGGQFFTTKKNIIAGMKQANKAMFMTKKERLKMVVEKSAAEDNIRNPVMPTYNVNVTDSKTLIPENWKTTYVLMATNDIPEGLKPGTTAFVNKKGKALHVKTEVPDIDLDSEEELVDSDADPGWEPEEIPARSKKRKATFDAVDVDIDEDEDIEESDEDPGWSPKDKKKGLDGSFTKKKKPVKKTKLKAKPATSLSTPALTSGVWSPASSSAQKQILIKDKEPTGPEPGIGDYLLEKSEVKNGEIPFLWRYKKGGLIQKFEKTIDDNGKVLYQNALNFSDWWACYADKYIKVETKTMFRYRNVEKIELLTLPDEIEEMIKASPSGSSSSTTPSTPTPVPKPKKTMPRATALKSTNDNYQEQEVSSTTSEPEYQVGQYILDKKEERNVDNFSVWKIESNILLKKYEMVIKKGKMYHRPVKTYRGYRDICKYYLPLKVRRAQDPLEDGLIEVLEESRPKITVEKDMEGEYDKNPLLHHFYVYMQVLLSQALEPGFLVEVNKNQDETYTFPMSEIDKIARQKMEQIERKIRWSNKIKLALNRAPYLREVFKPDEKKKCEALLESDDPIEEVAFLFGDEYDRITLKSKGSQQSQEFKIGKTAVEHICSYHQLCHFKYNLYEKCVSKVKLVRESKEGSEPEVEDIMDSCLGNKSWVLQNFVDFNNLIQMPTV